MLRSCYSTKARFYEGDATEDDITWYFTEPTAPFLPVASVINSLNWVEKRGLTDTGHAGEVVGAARPYSKGGRDVSLMHVSYCGGTVDWLGLGVRPAEPLAVNMFGNPSCCGAAVGIENCPVSVITVAYDFSLPFTFVPGFYVVSSELTFNYMLGLQEFNPGGWPLQIDLWYSNPNGSGTNYQLTDFAICEFPGYAPNQAYTNLILGPSAGFGSEMDNEYNWTASGIPSDPTKATALGIVASDPTGTVCYYQVFTAGAAFFANGDYLNITIGLVLLSDY